MTEQLINAVDDSLVDEAIHAGQHIRARRRKRRAFVSAAASISAAAACFLLLSGQPDTAPTGETPPTAPTAATASATAPTDSAAATAVTDEPHEFGGLPPIEFCLGEIEQNLTACRIWGAFHLSDFFRNPAFTPSAFAIVRVLEAEQFTEELNESLRVVTRQDSKLEILSTVRGGGLPETITIQQHCMGGRTSVSDRPTNLLREGGVYLLPLWYAEYEDIGGMWHNMADLDVLFEVDDRGLIWSHSPYEGFSKYDGRPVEGLIQAITDITGDEDYEIAVSVFGMNVNHSELTEITVQYMAVNTNEWENPYYVYDVVSENGDIIGIITYVEGLFEVGGRYLVLLRDDYDYGHEINSRGEAARINADGTITPLTSDDGWNSFLRFGGRTVGQMRDYAARAKSFYSRY
jgi:hypothetical protein